MCVDFSDSASLVHVADRAGRPCTPDSRCHKHEKQHSPGRCDIDTIRTHTHGTTGARSPRGQHDARSKGHAARAPAAAHRPNRPTVSTRPLRGCKQRARAREARRESGRAGDGGRHVPVKTKPVISSSTACARWGLMNGDSSRPGRATRATTPGHAPLGLQGKHGVTSEGPKLEQRRDGGGR